MTKADILRRTKPAESVATLQRPNPNPLQRPDISDVSSVASVAATKWVKEFKENYQKLQKIADTMTAGGAKREEVRRVLLGMNQVAIEEDMDVGLNEVEIDSMCEDACKGLDRKYDLVSEKVSDWIDHQHGWFTTDACYRELIQYDPLFKRSSLRSVIKRLHDKGRLEAGSKAGLYRKIDTGLMEMELDDFDAHPVDINLPLGMNEMCSILPKSVILFSGVTNSGKTALNLNMAFDNRHKWDVHYFSTDMPLDELKIRLAPFDYSPKEWKKIKFYDRDGNFQDVIQPDGLNIIDYLEIDEDFYLVAKTLRQIYKKLNKGVAVVSLQRKPNQVFGLGGYLTTSKPRLAVNIGHGEIEIMKAKIWKDPDINPDNRYRKFKLVHGCKFVSLSEWYLRERVQKEDKYGK